MNKMKIIFGGIVFLIIFFMSYNFSLAAGCCVTALSTGKNSCVDVTDSSGCTGTGSYVSGACSTSAQNCDTSTATTTTTTTTTTTGSSLSGSSVTGTSSGGTAIVPCGRSGGSMCTLCDLIKGINNIIQYIMKITIGLALLAMAIGGVLYIVSAGESSAMEKAKSTIKSAAIGFVIIFAAWLIVNTTISYLGVSGTLGMNSTTTWGQFDCSATGK